MTRLTSFLLTIVIITSCANADTTRDNSQKVDISKIDTIKSVVTSSTVDTAFKLDFFKALPDTIDGCGEYFTYDTSKVANDKYIFLSNLTDFAIIKIKGKDVYLNRDTTESKEINDKSYIAVYKGQGYKAILTIKQTKTYDEGGFYSGTLQIIGDKIKATFKVHGEAGC
jgi:hypothetical protein